MRRAQSVDIRLRELARTCLSNDDRVPEACSLSHCSDASAGRWHGLELGVAARASGPLHRTRESQRLRQTAQKAGKFAFPVCQLSPMS